ncbi:MAG: hypothetical protein A2521_06330 [Deltaproteobacteria bacterium RIFOXYD12_FULL_57_12]|nr:MAG: hypothetical protein A2521_06330 [Deltaproteobacteria bacterium RIFOXYD12_FULL_57_12]
MKKTQLPDFFQHRNELLATARLCIRGNRLDRAVTLCDHLRGIEPDSADTHCLRAEIELARGCPQKALEHITISISLIPEHAGYHELRGDIHEAANAIQEAEDAYRCALQAQQEAVAACIKLGKIEKNKGNLQEAHRLCAVAAGKEPENVDALAALGDALFLLGRHNEAQIQAETALARDPNNITALKTLHNITLAAGRPREAAAYSDRLIRLAPADSDCYVMKASALSEAGDVYAALQEIQQAVRLHPDDAKALWLQAVLFIAVGKWGDPCVLQSLDRALQRAPDNIDVLAAKADVLDKKGDHQASFAIVEQLCGPGASNINIRAHRIYMRLAAKFKKEDSAKALIERLMSNIDRFQGPAASSLLFGAGQFYDKIGEHDKAFACFEKANNLKPRAYEPIIVEKVVYRAINTFTADALRQLPKAGKPHAVTPIFVVGMPRSGTSLTEKILTCHPDVHGAGELGAIENLANTSSAKLKVQTPFPECIREADQQALENWADLYLRQFDEKTLHGRTFVVDKLPANAFYLGLINLLFPQSPVIHCIRHPLDMALSCYSLEFSMAGLNFTFNLANIAHYYQNYRRIMEHWRGVLPPGTILPLRYEDLVAKPEKEIRNLLDFCGLSWNLACLEPHKSSHTSTTASYNQTRQPLNSSSVGRWQHYEKQLAPFMEAFAPLDTP